VLCNLFLADELNRATSRTQSALLEAMEEGQVTVDGNCYPVPQPFTVIATQNPTGAAGTQPLPDSQMDRFMLRLSLGYPDAKDELAMILGRQQSNPLQALQPILDRKTLIQLQALVENTHAGEVVSRYAVDLIQATRTHPLLLRGASPRATLALMALSKSMAQLRGRDYVLPEDIQEAFPRCIAHRVLLSPAAQAQDQSAEDVLRAIVSAVAPPKLR
jgi:MoxR-like ATPase